MLGFFCKIFHHCNSHKGLAFFFFYNSSKILLVFLSLCNLRFGRYRNCSNPHIYFFPARSFAQVEFEDCAYDHIRNKICPAIKSEQQQSSTGILAMSTASMDANAQQESRQHCTSHKHTEWLWEHMSVDHIDQMLPGPAGLVNFVLSEKTQNRICQWVLTCMPLINEAKQWPLIRN